MAIEGWQVQRRRAAKPRGAYLNLGICAIVSAIAGFLLSSEPAEAVLLWTLNLLLAGLVVHQLLSRRHPLFSLRNLFLLGFVLFQTQSAADAVALGFFGGVDISDVSGTSQRFIGVSLIFLVVFLTTHRLVIGRSGKIPADRPHTLREAQARTSLARAAAMAFVSLVLVYAIPAALAESIQNAAAIGAVGVAGATWGLIGWVWVHHPMKPPVVVASALTLLATLPAALADQFGRRPVLTLFGSLLWCMYFSRWYTARPGRALRWIAVGSVASLIPLALFTSARDPAEHNRSAASQLAAIRQEGSVVKGLESLRRDEITGAMTLWAMENLGPGQDDRPPLQSLRYLVEMPVPRELWGGKSVPLSREFARLANVPNVSFERITIPAGILGSSWADGGWFAAVLYAGLLGLLLGRIDRLLFLQRQNPVMVIAIGAGFGQVLAFARGETSILIAVFAVSVTVVWLLLRALAIDTAAALVEVDQPSAELSMTNRPIARMPNGRVR